MAVDCSGAAATKARSKKVPVSPSNVSQCGCQLPYDSDLKYTVLALPAEIKAHAD